MTAARRPRNRPQSKLKEAREKGQIAKTPDLSTWVAMLATTVLLQITFQRGATVRCPTCSHDMGLVIAHPDQGAASKFAAGAMWKAVGVVAPMLIGMMLIGSLVNARAGRLQADLEEAEARLQPPQRVQGHQAHGRPAGVVGALQSARQDRVLVAVAWPAVAARDRTRSRQRPRHGAFGIAGVRSRRPR